MYKLKKITAWILLVSLLMVGISWPDITTSADVSSDFGLGTVEADTQNPYSMIVLEKSNSKNTFYLIKTSEEMFYMNDYKLVVTPATAPKYYVWETNPDDATGNSKIWNQTTSITYEYDADLGMTKLLLDSSKNEQIVKYITEANATIDKISNLEDGLYVLGYTGIGVADVFKNHNYLTYAENNENPFNNEFYLNSSVLDDSYFNGILSNLDSEVNVDFSSLVVGQRVQFPQFINAVNGFYLNADWEIVGITDNSWLLDDIDENDNNYSLIEDVLTPDYVDELEKNVNGFIVGKKNVVGDDVTYNLPKSAIVKVELTLTADEQLSEYASNLRTVDFYMFLEGSNDNKLDDLKNTYNTSLYNETFLNIATDYMNSDEMSSNLLVKNDITEYNLYSGILNTSYKKLSIYPNEENVTWSIKSVDNVSELTDFSDYVKINKNSSTGISSLFIDSRKITEYRRDQRNDEAFNGIVLNAEYSNGEKNVISEIDVTLEIEQFLNDFMAEGANLGVAKISYSVSTVGQYGALPSNLRYLDTSTYQTIINYSEYQLLFYTTNKPTLFGNKLMLDDSCDVEIYKATNNEWTFFNYVSDLDDGYIEIPVEAGQYAIDYVNYILTYYTDSSDVVYYPNEIDNNRNIKTRRSKIPSTYLGGGSNNIYELNDYYYVLLLNNIEYVLISTNTRLSIVDGLIVYPNDAEFYNLIQNTWINCDEKAIEVNKYKIMYDSTFKQRLVYSNDNVLGNNLDSSQIGSVDYFRYIPKYSASEGYDFIISDTNSGFKSIEYKNAEAIIENGKIKFVNVTSGFDVNQYTYATMEWYYPEDESILYYDENNVLTSDSVAGSILYSSKNLYANGIKVFDTTIAKSTLISSEIGTGDFSAKRPSLDGINVDGINLNDYVIDGNLTNFYLKEGQDGSYYFYTYPSTLYYDYDAWQNYEFNGLNVYLDETDIVTSIICKYNAARGRWEFYDTQVFNSETGYYVDSADDILWFGQTIIDPSPEGFGFIRESESVKFLGETSVDTTLYEKVNEDGSTYSINIIDGKTIADGSDYLQPIDNTNAYWIEVFDNLGKIEDPSLNDSKGIVADGNISEIALYVPMYTSATAVLKGKVNTNGIAFDINGQTSILKTGAWYTPIETKDNLSPIIDVVYAVNNNLKIVASDRTEYQEATINGITYFYQDDDGYVWQKIPKDFYDSLSGVGVELKTQIGSNYYMTINAEIISESEIIPNTRTYIDSEGFVNINDTKIQRSEIISKDMTIYYSSSGVNSVYGRILNDEGINFNENVTIVTDEIAYTTTTTTGRLEKGTIIKFNNLNSIKLPESGSLGIYAIDNANNKSDIVTIDLNLNSNNSIIYPIDTDEVSQIIKDEIDEAILLAQTDSVAPEILYAYIYRGTLHIAARDIAQENVSPIGFYQTEWNSSFKYNSFTNEDNFIIEDIEYLDDKSSTKTLVANSITLSSISDNITFYKNSLSFPLIKDENLNIQEGEITFTVRDRKDNTTTQVTIAVSEEDNNSVVYKSCNDAYILSLLEKARNEKENPTIDTYPVINSIYTLNGILYVIATDNIGIEEYGYEWKYSAKLAANTKALRLEQKDYAGNVISTDTNVNLLRGDTIAANTVIYKTEYFQAVNVPNIMTIYVTDTKGQTVSRQITIVNANQVIYGDVPDEIKDAIENGGGITIPDDTKPPIFTSVYTYNGYLYVEGYSNVGLHTYGYGYKPTQNMIIDSYFSGWNVDGKEISIPPNTIIASGTHIYKAINYQKIRIPTYITVYLRDTNGITNSLDLYVDKDNYLYMGKIPSDLEGIIIPNPNPNDDEDDKTIPTPTPTPGDNNPTPTPTPTPDDNDDKITPGSSQEGDAGNVGGGKINPDPSLKGIDWNLYDYIIELLDRNTGRVVYTIRKDAAIAVDMPKLQDSTTYRYLQKVVKESDNSLYYTIFGLYSSKDESAPVITKVWYSKNRIYVSAYDEGGLAEKAYNFVIEGARNQNPDNFINSNNIRVIYGDKIKITVKDAAGNSSYVEVEINENSKDTLYECLNPKEPIYVNTGETKSVSYWLAYLKSKFNLDITNITPSDTNNSDNMIFTSGDNSITFDFSGNGVLAFYDSLNNKYITLALRTSNAGKSYRSIIVELDSETNFALAFENKLKDVFGDISGITWAVDGKYLSRDVDMIEANYVGVGKVVAKKGDIVVNFYVVVAKSISGLKFNSDLTKENFAYTYILGDKFKASNVLNMSVESDNIYVVLDSHSEGVSRKDNEFTVSSVGRKKIVLLDVVNDISYEVKFEVVAISPHISQFTDIIGSSSRADIEYLCERGIIEKYPDQKYKPNNKMTSKEFLTMLNRIRLVYDSNFVIDKQAKIINLSDKDFDYFSSMNILINLKQDEVDKILSTYTLNKAITFEEVVNLISATLMYNDYHNESGYTVPGGLTDVSDAALHLLSLGIIKEDDARNGTREVTRAEIAYLLTETVKFLEY